MGSVMKRIIIGFVITWIVIFIGLWIGARVYLDPELKKQIELRGTDALGGPVRVNSVKTQLLPFEFVLNQLSFSSPERKLNGTIDEVRLSANIPKILFKKFDLDLKLVRPVIELGLSEKPPAEKDQLKEESLTTVILPKFSESPYSISALLSVISGQIKIKQNERVIALNDLTVGLNIPDLTSQWSLKTGFDLEVNQPKFHLPIFLETKFKITDQMLDVSKSKLVLAGVDIDFEGQSNIQNFEQNWKLFSHIPQLETLKSPVDTGCVHLKSGSVNLKIDVGTKPHFEQPTASGSISLQKVKTQLKCQTEQAATEGSAVISSEVAFNYGDENLSISKLKLDADFSDLKIQSQDLFLKTAGIPMFVTADGAIHNDILLLKTANLQLERLKIQARGSIATKPTGNSDFGIELPPTRLEGFEKFIPLMKGNPLSGEVEVRSKVSGVLMSPDSLNIEIAPLKARQVKAQLAWESSDKKMSVKGPISADIDLQLKSKGRQLQEGRARLQTDLGGLSVITDQMKKTANQPLSLSLYALQKGQSLEFTKSQAQLPGGIVQVAGRLSEFSKPQFNFQLSTQKLVLSPLLKMLPKASPYTISGQAKGRIQIKGSYDLVGGIEKSPIIVFGELETLFDQIIVPERKSTHPAASTHGKANEKVPPPEPMFPLWPLYQKLNLSIKNRITALTYGSLVVKGASTSHAIRNGILSSDGQIQSIFGGRLILKSSHYPLLIPAPRTSFSGVAQGIQLAQVVEWLSKDWKNLVSGSASGEVEFKMAHPSRPDFVKTSEGRGTLKVKDGFLSTLQFDKLVNEKLAKIPGIGQSANLHTKGATADISAVFSLKDGNLNFAPLQAVTPERNELIGRGWVSALDKTCELQSDIFLSNPPVRGSIREANSDASGRLKVPVVIKGSVFSPEVDITGTTVKTLLENTARYEGEKLKKKLSLETQKQGEDLGKKLKEEAEKKFKNLFK